jgi:Periplasmic binding protein
MCQGSYWCRGRTMALAALCTLMIPNLAIATDSIRVGLSVALTGSVAPAGKQVLAGLQIWRDDLNAKGGLLGRPIELVFYDDQSNPQNVPALYTKLIEVDKVDLLIGPYATNMVAPAIPVLMQYHKTTIGILANAANSKFHYDQYFSMLPTGPFLRARGWRPAAPEDRRHRHRRCRICPERCRRRTSERQAGRWFRNRIGTEVSTADDRLRSGNAGGQGAQSRHRLRRRLSTGLRRHHSRRQ